MSEKQPDIKVEKGGRELDESQIEAELRAAGISYNFKLIKNLINSNVGSETDPEKKLHAMKNAMDKALSAMGKKLDFDLKLDKDNNIVIVLGPQMDKLGQLVDKKVKEQGVEQQKPITEESFGRFYRSGATENWDIPDSMSVDYNGYSDSKKGITGRNIAITAKAAGNAEGGSHLFKNKKLVNLDGDKKAYVVVGEGKDITVSDSYKDFDELKRDISSKSEGAEAWVSQIDGKSIYISEVGDPEVHRLIQTKVIDKGGLENPLEMQRDEQGNYKLGLFGGGEDNDISVNKEKVQALFSYNGEKLSPNSGGKQELGTAPKSMKDDETYFVTADQLGFGAGDKIKNYDVVFKIRKEGDKLMATSTEKISVYEESDIGFGQGKFNLRKYLKDSNFEDISSLNEKKEQKLSISSYYGWGDLNVNLKFDESKKKVESVSISTIGKNINIKDFGDLSISSYDQKGFEAFYNKVWNVVNSSLYNTALAEKGEFIQGGNAVQSDANGLSISYEGLNKIYADKKAKSGADFRKQLGDFLGKSREQYEASSEFVGYEPNRHLLGMGLVTKSDLRRSNKKNYDYKEADLSSINYKELGDIAGAFESGGDIGMVSTGKGDAGGVSYGKYQLSSKMGSVTEFLKFCETKDPDMFKRLSPLRGDMSSCYGNFANEWKKIAQEEKGQGNNGRLYKLNETFCKTEFYIRPLNGSKLKQEVRAAINNSNKLKEAFFSSCLQHGSRGVDIFNECVIPGKTDAENLDSIYKKRENIMFHSGNSDKVKDGVNNRYPKEKRAILEKIA